VAIFKVSFLPPDDFPAKWREEYLFNQVVKVKVKLEHP
jgi:hypothetical protein